MSSRRRAPINHTALEKPPHGRNGLGPERVAEIQRARMLTAMAEVSAERGATNVTVAHVVARAGISRRTFYELFEGREGCFLAAFDEAVERAASRMVEAYGSGGRWRERVRASLTALLEFLDDEPGMGRLVIVETLGAGPKALERRSRVLAQIITAVDEGRREVKGGSGLPPLTAEGVVGAVLAVIHARLLEGHPERLVGLLNQLMSMIVLPYLGPAAARRELKRPVPKASAGVHTNKRDPLRELEMRLTYRTVRVLMAVGAHPGASNRQIGDAAGVSDQGQISKLLARLKRLGLIENTGPGSPGEPNAWRLTETGRDVHGAIAAQTTRS